MQDAREYLQLNRNSSLAQFRRQRLAFGAQNVELRQQHENRRQPGQIGAQRCRERMGPVSLVRT